MIMKWLKRGAIVTMGCCVAGALLFGGDAASYVRSSAKSVQTAVKDSVPIEFELRRARDLLEDIIPEMHANIRLIAEEEVEVAALKASIVESENSMQDEQMRIKTLRAALETSQVRYSFSGREYPRSYVKEDLARRFEHFRESELVLASKRRLLTSRENSLHAAMGLLDRTRGRKRTLEDKIEALAAQHRLVKAAAVGSRIQFDSSKLAQTEKLIVQIKKRLDVAERVLAQESHFIQAIPVDTVVEKDLLTQVDDYFSAKEQDTAYVKAGSQKQQAHEVCDD